MKKAWSIDRSIFKMVVKVAGEEKNQEKFNLIRTIKDGIQYIEYRIPYTIQSIKNINIDSRPDSLTPKMLIQKFCGLLEN